jgi:hypothetical protein
MKRALILTALLALPFVLRADAPNVYAIRGARIVTAAGAPIENGTVVVRRGVIDAVGASVTVPPEATVIEGAGITVYPGLIDLGNTRAADQATPTLPQNLRTTADVERWKRTQILKPQARAADAVKVDDADLTQAGVRRHDDGVSAAVGRRHFRSERPRQRRRPAGRTSGRQHCRRATRPRRREIAGCASRIVSRSSTRAGECLSGIADGCDRVRAAGVR